MRCNHIGRERMHGELHLPGTTIRMENTDCSHLSVKGRQKLGRKLEPASNYPVASPT